MSGMLITFEGGEGTGKTTIAKEIHRWLFKKGLNIELFREPGSTNIGEQIRTVIHNINNTEMEGVTEALLYQAGRAQLYRERINPLLDNGGIIIMDRSIDSSIVYQGAGRGIDERFIELLNNISTNFRKPDLTVLLDVDPVIGLSRRKMDGNVNRMDSQPLEFYQNVRQKYLDMAQINDRGRWKIIDASRSLSEVYANVMYTVGVELGSRGKLILEGRGKGTER